MNLLQDHHHEYEIQPFFSIWWHPKRTAQYLINQKKWTYTIFLILLGGIASSIMCLEDTKLYPSYATWLLLMACILSGPFIGIFTVLISTVVTWLVGKIFGGKGSFEDILRVKSALFIPTITITPFMIMWMANSPQTFFDTDYVTSNVMIGISTISFLIAIIISVWTFVINVAGVAVAHRFSNWKAFFTIFIPTFLLLIVCLTFGVLFFIAFSTI